MTFSIVARSPDASMFGVALASSSPAVAARCAHARAAAGAVATQNITNPALGPQTLALLARGEAATAAIAEALAGERHPAYRQLLAIGRTGPPAIRSGAAILGVHGQQLGRDCAAAGNLLARSDIPAAMIAAFENSDGHVAARLLAALQAAEREGGEAGPIHSAGLLVVREVSWPIVDLRVDWVDHDPIGALATAWQVYAPQIEDYVQRAHDPSAAPSYRVAGDP